MSIELNELRESARQVLADTAPPAPEEQTWQQLVELGWLLAPLAEGLGGLGLGVAGACALQGELGRQLAAAPFLPALLAIEAVAHAELADREGWLERLTGGDYVAASLVHAPRALQLQDNRISGQLAAVQSADRASHLLACADDCVALVPLTGSGVGLQERPTWDRSRRLFDVTLREVAIEPALLLARGEAARQLARRVTALRDFALAADAVGGAEALLAMTVEHLQTRQQFGRPLALFQSLKHRCADLKTLLAAADAALAESLARCGDTLDSDEALQRARRAKFLASSAFATVAEESLQLHGGIGMASEHPCHLYLKRALLLEHLGDSNDRCQLDIAEGFLQQLP